MKVQNAKKTGAKKKSTELDRNEVTVFLDKFFLEWFLKFDNQSRAASSKTNADSTEDEGIDGVKKVSALPQASA